jgi:hypothetical protein
MSEIVNDNSKKKLSVHEYHELIFSKLEDMDEIDNQLKTILIDYNDKVKELNKKKSKINKDLFAYKKKVDIQFDREINQAKKEKRKRKVPVNGGIMKLIKIPKSICKYTGLDDDDIKMSRPQLIRLLNDQFKKDGFRQGQEIILNKKTAKLFGKKVDKNGEYLIPFKGFQTFLTELINYDLINLSKKDKKKSKKQSSVSIVV